MGTVKLNWIGGQMSVGVDSYGHPIVIGSRPEETPEWAGLKPSDLLLLSAAACSTYDVVMILTKQREPLKHLEVSCEGKQLPEAPYTFTDIHLHYTARGNVSAQKLARAIELSETKYCSVLSTLRPTVKITSDFEIVSEGV